MPTPVHEMTDLQLDATLTPLYREHRNAGLVRRGVLHTLIVLILGEQKTRRDEWLRDRETRTKNVATIAR